MSQSVFIGWPIWEKLVFILGCAIVLTIMAGMIKTFYAHWRLRQDIATIEHERLVEENQWNIVAEVAHPIVPFGAKALESGIGTEGVWYSRSNSLESFDEPLSDLELNDSAPVEDVLINTRHEQQHISEDDTSATQNQRQYPDQRRSRIQYPPLSSLRYAGESFQYRSNTTPRRSDASFSSNSVVTTSTHSTDRVADGIEVDHSARPRQHSADFVLLDRHRSRQAAEIGQLTPRTRKSESIERPSRMSDSQIFRPAVKPFQQFIQSTPSHYTQLEAVELEGSPVEQTAPTLPQKHPGRRSFEKMPRRNDQVIRGHGSGFEILRPGTLDAHDVNTNEDRSSLSSKSSRRGRWSMMSERQLQKSRRFSSSSLFFRGGMA